MKEEGLTSSPWGTMAHKMKHVVMKKVLVQQSGKHLTMKGNSGDVKNVALRMSEN